MIISECPECGCALHVSPGQGADVIFTCFDCGWEVVSEIYPGE